MKKILDNIIFRIILLSTILLIIISFVLERLVFRSQVYSVISNSDWAGFLGGYIGAIAGGIISIIGIWYQLNKEKERKTENVKKYINHILKKLNKIENDDKRYYEERIREGLKFTKYSSTYTDGEYELLHIIEFNNTYIENNLDTILSLASGEDILDLNEKLITYNKFISKGKTYFNEKFEIFKLLKEAYGSKSILENIITLIILIDKNKNNEVIKKQINIINNSIEKRNVKVRDSIKGSVPLSAYIDSTTFDNLLTTKEKDYNKLRIEVIKFLINNLNKINQSNSKLEQHQIESYREKLIKFNLNDLNIIEISYEIKELICRIKIQR